MKFTSAPSIVEKEVVEVKVRVQFNSLMPLLGISVSRCNDHPKTSEIRNAVRDAGYIVESCRGGSYCVTGGTPESLEALANEIRAAYEGQAIDADASKVNEIVKLLILADHVTTFPANFDAVKAARTCGVAGRHLDTAKKISEVLK